MYTHIAALQYIFV